MAVDPSELATTGGGDRVLPPGYGEEQARQDERDLATLRARDVNWRVKRRLRHRVGGEDLLLERIAAWHERAPAPPPARAAVATSALDAQALAAEYREVCGPLYGPDDPQVVANAEAIASGAVLPWDARHVIEAERERAQTLRRSRTAPTTSA